MRGLARLKRVASRVAGRVVPERPPRLPRGLCGFIDVPEGGILPRGPVRLYGWCLIPGGRVARVDVAVDGRRPEPARLCMERFDVAALTDRVDAPICGWEHKADLSDLPAEVDVVRVEASAETIDGRRVELPALDLAVAA